MLLTKQAFNLAVEEIKRRKKKKENEELSVTDLKIVRNPSMAKNLEDITKNWKKRNEESLEY